MFSASDVTFLSAPPSGGSELDWGAIAPLEAEAAGLEKTLRARAPGGGALRAAWQLLRPRLHDGAAAANATPLAAPLSVEAIAEVLLSASTPAAIWAAHRALCACGSFFAPAGPGLWAPRPEHEAERLSAAAAAAQAAAVADGFRAAVAAAAAQPEGSKPGASAWAQSRQWADWVAALEALAVDAPGRRQAGEEVLRMLGAEVGAYNAPGCAHPSIPKS